eukprot:GILI01019651.1.p2 GENE.GILI01019651.1~~GILI01019651.1.p2  ORF type:complete len:327 (+),score=104.81 GILI01019651.1:80-982(+)
MLFQLIGAYLSPLNLFSFLYWGPFRGFFKFFLRVLTGRHELERLCALPGTQTEVVERSIRASKTLKAIVPVIETVNFDAEQVCSEVIKRKALRQVDAFSVNFKECLKQLDGVNVAIQTVGALKKTPYNKENSEHETQLELLWSLLKPEVRRSGRLTKEWGEIGFQGEDPATDFRGMGLLGLVNLVYFAKTYSKQCQQVLANSNHPAHWYSFAIAGINITGWCVKLLESRQVNRFFYRTADASADPLEAFNELYCLVFWEFNKFWQEEKPNVMMFEQVSQRFRQTLPSLLPKNTRKISLGQ